MAVYQPRYPLARASTVKDELLVIQIMRQSVMECDPSYMLNLLKGLHTTRQQVVDHEGCITLCFEGWDDDPRETAEIPEIRTYFAALTEKFPYWLHYVEKSGDTFFHVLRLLCTGHYEQKTPGMVAWCFDDLQEMQRICLHLVGQMDKLHRRHNIPCITNRRINEEIAQLIECTLE